MHLVREIFNMSKYTILDNGMGDFVVKEKTRTHTGVRWITLENTIDSFDSLEKAIKDLPSKMPIQSLFFDEQEKAYVNIIKSQGKTERKHKRSTGLFR